jgi:hypothetical protein
MQSVTGRGGASDKQPHAPTTKTNRRRRWRFSALDPIFSDAQDRSNDRCNPCRQHNPHLNRHAAC